MLEKYLEDLEERIKPDEEENLLSRWKSFWEGGVGDEAFIPRRELKNPPGIEWPETSVNRALEDSAMMALQQLRVCSELLASGGGGLLNIRCNYGTGILPSVFGAELFMMREELDTLPTSKPLGSEKAIEAIIDAGLPDIYSGLGAKVFETTEFFKDMLRAYPKTEKYVKIYHPDLQGPMDVCELLYGSGLFISLVDKPDFVHRLLSLITQTYREFLAKWLKVIPPCGAYSTHWGMLIKGGIMLREDSAMNLSPGMFEEFIKPYDEILLDCFGGGCIHFCGRGDHYIAKASEIKKLHAINMSQPELNDMEKILPATAGRGIKIIGFSREYAENPANSGSHLKNIQCF